MLPVEHNLPEYSVSEIAGALKRTVEDRFGYVRVKGEITGWKPASSGHCYFRLKDNDAVLDSVCWRGTVAKFNFKPEDGLEVVASGKITTYAGKSSYQIVVDRLEPAGAGALMALLEARKQKLAAEGLFAEARKKPLPFLPQTIGVITSPTGAVIRDILHRIEERFPVHVLVWPVAVQGEGAAEQIAAAIHGFNNSPTPPDLLIVARGGGSLEDLWSFNEEVVVRAAAASKIPLISAVGHETDTTLIDYAADKRAPTPTAAAEMAVPVRTDLIFTLQQMQQRMAHGTSRKLAHESERLSGYLRGLPKPAQLLATATQRLDDWSERLSAGLPALFARKERELAVLLAGLKPTALNNSLREQAKRVCDFAERLGASLKRVIDKKSEQLLGQLRLLESVSYVSVLSRGFALVTGENGELINSAKKARENTLIHIQFKDETVNAVVEK